ncbi:MAG TPA: carbohydrate ABC transporter permease, partial [Chloroflexota bacterium]|nr:carbohydrate ABC transporter permease [Chloroflexota bacterium]
ILFPVYWLVLSTFQPDQYSITWPPPLFFKGFNWSVLTNVVTQNGIASNLLHSAQISTVTVVVTLIFAVPGGFLLSRLRWRGATAFGFVLLFTQMMPGAVVIIPELQFFREMGWINNLTALSLVYAAFNVPLGIWILKASFDSIPGEIIDAALVDGCSALGVLRRILIPLSLSGMVAVGVVAFFGSWNDYLFAAQFVTDRSLYTAALAIATFRGEGTIQLNAQEAAGLLFAILPVILYLSVQRHVVRGLTAGAVK